MPKHLFYGQYEVSFNCAMGDMWLGETSMNSVEYSGDDIDALAKEVCGDSVPEHPMTFYKLIEDEVIALFGEGQEDYVIGVFLCDDEDIQAVMYI